MIRKKQKRKKFTIQNTRYNDDGEEFCFFFRKHFNIMYLYEYNIMYSENRFSAVKRRTVMHVKTRGKNNASADFVCHRLQQFRTKNRIRYAHVRFIRRPEEIYVRRRHVLSRRFFTYYYYVNTKRTYVMAHAMNRLQTYKALFPYDDKRQRTETRQRRLRNAKASGVQGARESYV